VITAALRNIYRINLGVRKYERVLLFSDRVAENEEPSDSDRERRNKLRSLSLLAAEAGKKLCASLTYFEYPATGSHGAEPPAELWERAFGNQTIRELKGRRLLSPLLTKKAREDDIARAEDIIRKYSTYAVHCVIALSNYSTSHTRFRDFLTRICGCRYASMPLFDIPMLEGAMNVDWKALSTMTRELAKIVDAADAIRIRTPNGSSLSFSVRGRKALSDTGILTRKGAFGNLPAGEVFLAPVEGSAQGRLVLEWGPTRQLSSPVMLMIRDGYVTEISGNDECAEYLRVKLSERRDNGNIAELGFGTNRAARRPDNILESEKIFGTIHIALGDNSSFGGKVKTPFHQDFVFFRPTVTLICKNSSRRDILKAGKFVY
jgi:leucyl aminopeptidase (aminopeptidase T)